jgi:hypothetical protein
VQYRQGSADEADFTQTARKAMAIKVQLRVFAPEETKTYRNQYTDSLTNMFVESIRVHNNFCTYQRWVSTDYTGPFSELKSGFLAYTS